MLTWWEGTISNIGTGEGEGVIVDSTYKEIARVRAGNGFAADVHEFLITPERHRADHDLQPEDAST